MHKPNFQPAQRVLFTAAALLGITLYGCGGSTPASSSSADSTAGGATSSAEYRLPVLRNAIHILGNLQRFDQQIALDQVVDRLNQWVHLQKVEVDWKVDPFMDSTLPKRYVDSPWLAHLKDDLFNHEMDGDFLRESSWLRDISNSSHGDKLDDLSTAEHLFDWTIRNIQLVAPPTAKPGQKAVDVSPYILARHSPSDILLQGYGTAEQRAWIFILLARQQNLDVVLLATPDPDHPDKPRPWLPALLHKVGDHEELYLFDSWLGLPIPGPGGKGIATLAQAIDDPAVLAHLDLDDSHHYPVKAAEAKQAIALVEASPGYLSKRMKMLEMQLVGTERMVLSNSPSETVARLKKVSHLSTEPRLWTWPYDVLNLRASDFQAPQQIKDIFILEQAPFLLPAHHGEHRLIDPNAPQRALDDLMSEGQTKMAQGEGKLPDKETPEERAYRRAMKENRPLDTNFPLAAGRVLQFRHEYGGEYGAKHYYIECRPGEDQMQDYVQELVNDFREPNQKPPVQRYAVAILRRKQDATYWLGCLSFDEGEYATAEEYFKNLVLDVWPKGCPWTDGAHYNLARTYEASGRADEAVKLYEADDSAQRHGNHLRGRWLNETAAEEKPEKTPEKKPAEGISTAKPAPEPESKKKSSDAPSGNPAAASKD